MKQLPQKMKSDLKKRTFFVKKFYKFKNITLVQRAYKAEYKEKQHQVTDLLKILFLISKKMVQLHPHIQK